MPTNTSAHSAAGAASPTFALILGPLWLALRRLWLAPRSPQAVVVALALWVTVAGNLALWSELFRVGVGAFSQPVLLLGIAVLVWSATTVLLSLLAWPRGMKPVWVALLVLAGVAQHYMLDFGVLIDTTMVGNVLATDAREARDLLSPGLVGHVLLVAGLPTLWLWRLPLLARRSAWGQLARSALLLAASVGLLAGGTLVMYRQIAPLVRSHMHLRYTINPLASILSTASVTLKPLFKRGKPFVPISAGAALGTSYAGQTRVPLLVLVVGETARAGNFSLNGYARDTTPELAGLDVLSWRNVRSCGTNTLASVPCMFSSLGKTGYEKRDAEYGNLLDVLQSAGLAVLWLDNQSGCKGVCNRVASASTAAVARQPALAGLCQDGECMDEALLHGLDERILSLPEAQRRNGVVIVMHQMGSHGPAYYKRATPAYKRFMPECTNTVLSECPQQEVLNGYDNSIAYTDHFLASTVQWLKSRSRQFDTAMLYVSDHGESLGEYGLYLHGVPYAFAPDVQKQVPMVAWLDGGLGARRHMDRDCLQTSLDAPLTHDNYFHTVLGFLDVQSPAYRAPLDAWAACRPDFHGKLASAPVQTH
ncbi:MAG: phosphoethanolamine--lipid A transferase [Ramlibacter sp.]|nr:phosphoethanolamine--lipid A transferase [Ramlibacter sp.]